MNNLRKLKVCDFSLEHTIDCGQFFLYEKNEDDGYYYVIQNNNIFKIKQEGEILFYNGTLGVDDNFITHFFSLDEDLYERTKTFTDSTLMQALDMYWGLRNIRQDLFQCMIGFVCSSASNIPKIKNNLRMLCKIFGDEVIFEGKVYHTFPNFDKIDDLEKIVLCKTGYRSKFIYSICEKLREYDNLEEIKLMSYLDSQKELMKFMGIGVKVADCICLFALCHKDSFPVDTWIKQIIEKMYLNGEEKSLKEISLYIKKTFVYDAGLAQQYLFHWARFNLRK